MKIEKMREVIAGSGESGGRELCWLHSTYFTNRISTSMRLALNVRIIHTLVS